MPIAALPQQTVRALGSSQVLTDSASLVKELIDNAIDGRATSVSVEISANSLDEIRVKDNGHGIAPDDRSLACIMHCTSKIRTLDELHDIGGRSLGFRGQALASAAEMSRCLTISTRIEGEQTATEMKFDHQGQIASEKRTSLAVGTTVRVEKFLHTLPVRRQAAEKTAVKSLARIKRLLQAYALARPKLRLTLKVLKAKNEKAHWRYPANAGLGNAGPAISSYNAATDVVGKKVIDQCEWVPSTWSRAGDQIDTATTHHNDEAVKDSFTFESILAKPGCDTSVISNISQYLSVDSRPISCGRGTMKQIVSIYKSHLRSSSNITDNSKITDPFLYMNIVCPGGSYDVNVEPAKDDVLFTDAEFVLGLAEKHFKMIYGERQKDGLRSAVPKAASKPSGIQVMLARKHPVLYEPSIRRPHILGTRENPRSSNVPQNEDLSIPESPGTSCPLHLVPNAQKRDQPSHLARGATVSDASNIQDKRHTNDTFNITEEVSVLSHDASGGLVEGMASSPKGTPWKRSMYAQDDDEDEDGQANEPSNSAIEPAMEGEAEEEEHLNSVHVSNPWAFAKLHAPFRPPARTSQQQVLDTDSNGQLPTPARQLGDVGDTVERRTTSSVTGVPTKGPSRNRIGNDMIHSSPSPFPFPLKARGRRKPDEAMESPAPSGREHHGRGSLDTWVRMSEGSNSDSLDETDAGEANREGRGPADIEALYHGPFVSARSLPMDTPLSEIPNSSARPRQKPSQKQQHRNTNKPCISPVNDPERVWFHTGEARERRPQQQPRLPQNIPTADILTLREDEDAESVIAETPHSPIHPDLARTMDYEARKQLVMQYHRSSLRQKALQPTILNPSNTNSPRTSPHKNRQNAAIAALHNSADPAPPVFEPSDPRGYLIHSKTKRRKTTLLPFETLREDTYMGSLMLSIDTASLDLSSTVHAAYQYDSYIHSGIIAPALAPSALTEREVSGWERRLKEIVKAEYRIEGMRPDEEMEGELEIDMWSVLREHDGSSEDVEVI